MIKEYYNELLREDKSQKIDYTYISDMKPAFDRVIKRLQHGENKYSRLNFLNCKDPKTYEESFLRHGIQYCSGMRDEDHLAAAAVNALILMSLEDNDGTR